MQRAMILMMFLVTTAQAADDAFPGVEGLMTEEEFSAAGLNRLRAGELDALNAWLIRYTAGEATVIQSTSAEVQEAAREIEVLSSISGDFGGWSGKTVFTLANGQIWRQRVAGRYVYRGPAEPEVKIERNWLGFFKLTLVDAGYSIGVSRVR